ncbi:trans-2,3-dihydro-3-hydroxyanthranilate isomerase [Brevibacterium iodinum ATCC 49514]|uniref:Trans-2,3-dihydro-3-hydroxyanthranilate isomerase n=2 Tax=Brevibacterium iodinum TaxID=31943 RepID=A0A2H1KKJ8_9MICO|nr:PhzF family phenazine biosynthesis protein [Brevibacterium iodinum]SMY00333.1 trans-2,3-dihydro-3-hydroxyanthranilate isomerase [Brevibacterium iodinum ATCC 49514]SUW70208.1 Trans-2,3-dihydro-3-hydroxyanthranilate isomerase [Brevibacterium iodinum]
MEHQYELVDAFSTRPLNGNPVAVFLDSFDLDQKTMQDIAAEFQLSEVVFIDTPRSDPTWVQCRIFTPVNELPFAGHPLLGAARVHLDRHQLSNATFATSNGAVRISNDPADTSSMQITQAMPTEMVTEHTAELKTALGSSSFAGPPALYDAGARHLVVPLRTVKELMEVRPDHSRLSIFEDMAINCYALENGVVFNRMFSPAYGVQEDAATGSACAPIVLHAVSLGLHNSLLRVEVRQGHKLGKDCRMTVSIRQDKEPQCAVSLSGATALVAHGTLLI